MSQLRTAFENRGYTAPWTSLEDEATYLEELLTEFPTIRESVVGESVNGNPMRLYALGTGTRYVFIVCQQHGSELSGREATLTLLREWASSSDPEFQRYLESVTLLVMPTAHPDNLTTRNNVNNVNINRDHVQLTQPETKAIHTVLSSYRPDIVIDVHEGANISRNYATGPALNGNIDADIRALSEQLESVVRSEIISHGFTWERYQGSRAMIGAENLHNNTGLQNYLSLLLESRRTYGDNSDAAQRFETQIIALKSIVDWHRGNVQYVRNTLINSRVKIQFRNDPIQLMTGTLPYNGPVIDPIPSGYLVSSDDLRDISVHVDMFNLRLIEREDAWFIPLNQASQNMIVYLLDEDSSLKVITGIKEFPQRNRNLQLLSNVIGYKYNYKGTIMNATIKVLGSG